MGKIMGPTFWNFFWQAHLPGVLGLCGIFNVLFFKGSPIGLGFSLLGFYLSVLELKSLMGKCRQG